MEAIIQKAWFIVVQQTEKIKNVWTPHQNLCFIDKYLINHIVKRVMVVLDPFMGSGTTGVACKKP